MRTGSVAIIGFATALICMVAEAIGGEAGKEGQVAAQPEQACPGDSPAKSAESSGKGDSGAAPANAEKAGKPAKSWTDIVKIIGDLRLRHETIAAEGKPEQNRMRFRARVGLSAKIVPWLDAIFQLASGTADPVSTNQTFSDAFGSKPVQIDLACLDFKTEGMAGLRIVAGKMPNPFHAPGSPKIQLIWDGDLTPEGAAGSFSLKSGKAIELLGTAGGFWVTERKDAQDTWLFGAQAGIKLNIAEGRFWARAGGSVFHFENMRGFSPLSDATKSFGNSTYTVGTAKFYAGEYQLIEGFAEIGAKIGDFSPAAFFDVVVNRGVDENGLGWAAGASLKAPLGIVVCVSWRVLEKDAVVGAFTDSDFGGGTTDAKGLVCGIEWEAVKNVKFALTYFENVTPIDQGKTYRRFQADVSLKF